MRESRAAMGAQYHCRLLPVLQMELPAPRLRLAPLRLLHCLPGDRRPERDNATEFHACSSLFLHSAKAPGRISETCLQIAASHLESGSLRAGTWEPGSCQSNSPSSDRKSLDSSCSFPGTESSPFHEAKHRASDPPWFLSQFSSRDEHDGF